MSASISRAWMKRILRPAPASTRRRSASPSYLARNSQYLQIAQHHFRQQHRLHHHRQQRRQQAAFAIAAALRHLGLDHGQPHAEVRRRRAPVQPERDQLRQLGRAHFPSPPTPGCGPRAARPPRSSGQDLAEFLLGLPTGGIVRHQYVGVVLSSITSPASCRTTGAFASNLTVNLGLRVRPRRSLSREVRPHGERLRHHHAESARRGRDGSLQRATRFRSFPPAASMSWAA